MNPSLAPLGKKILVIGCPGSGKTTFAQKLRDKSSLPLYHLDALWHKPDRSHLPREEFDRRLQEILSQEAYILDGNYSRTLPWRLSVCDTAFLFDLPTQVCLEGALARLGQPRTDLPWIDHELDPRLQEEILNFRQENLPQIYSLLQSQKCTCRAIVFHSREEADAFLRSW